MRIVKVPAMNADMAFEALFLSCDAGAFRVINQCLRELSIVPTICFTANSAATEWRPDRTDLLLLDFDIDGSLAILESIWKAGNGRKPTVVALSRTRTRIPGAHFVLSKPVTHESGASSFKAIYQHMLCDYRQHVRCSLMAPAEVIDENLRTRHLIVTDIGQGGLGLMTRDEIPIGSTLKVKLELPHTARCMQVHVRVLWKREYSRVGCEFQRISTLDATMLQDWIRSRSVVKKTLVEV
jgi:hypothetical protein